IERIRRAARAMLDRLRASSRSVLFTVVGAAVGLLLSIFILSNETLSLLIFDTHGYFWPFFGTPFFSILFIIFCTLVLGYSGYVMSTFPRARAVPALVIFVAVIFFGLIILMVLFPEVADWLRNADRHIFG
ncbi:MAG: hypothetical protein ACYS5F_12200, partial [Planctomycetota bacterium]